jgi:DNA repair exonuclease SbcCD ATPase subunit
MKFNFLELKNFKSYGDDTIRLDLNQETTTILIGENGNGKTTFIDAIIWCIYGKNLSNVDDIVNRSIKKNCKVEVNFNIGNKNYSIIRYRKHDFHGNGLLLFDNNQDVSKSKITETQSLIDDIIGINYDAMISSIIYSNEIYTPFLRSKQSRRLEIIENVLSLKKIQEYYKIVKEVLNPINEALAKNNESKLMISTKISTIIENINGYKEKIKKDLFALKIEKQNIEKKIFEVDSFINEYKNININEEIFKIKKYKESLENNEKINEEIFSLNKKIHNIDVLSEELYKNKTEVEKISSIKVDDEINKIDKYNNVKNHNTLISLKQSEINKKIIDTNSFENEIKRIEKSINTLKNKKEDQLKLMDVCPTCGQEIKPELTKKLLEELDVEINENLEKLESKNKELKKHKDKNKELENEIVKLESEKKEETENSKYEKEYLSEINKKVKDLQNEIIKLESEVRIKDIENKNIKERIQERENGIIKDLIKSDYTLEEVEKINEKLDNLQKEKSDFERKKELINEKAKNLYDKNYVSEQETKISELNNQIVEVNKEIKKKENEALYYNFLQEVFSNKSHGVKKYIIDKTINKFNESINFLLPLFFETEVEMSFNKDLEETILVNKKNVPFSTFSSGEKARLELAISFSLFDMAKTFFSSETNLLVFDEILDKNLDDKGIRSTIDIVNNLSENNSVFVTSHRDEYKDSFQNKIYIYKDDNGFSKIRQR